MKKRTLLLTAAACSASMLACIPAMAESVDSVIEKYNAASTAQNATNAQITMGGDVSIATSDGSMTLNLAGTGDLNVRCTLDPLAVSMTGTFEGTALGETYTMDYGMYVVTAEDGTISTYVGTNGEWAVYTVEGEETVSLSDVMETASSISVSDIPLTYTLEEGDGYVLSCDITWADIPGILTWATNLAADLAEDEETDPQEVLDEALSYITMLDDYLGGLVIHTETAIDAETFLADSFRMDLSGSDLSTINEILGMLASSYLSDDENELEMTVEIGDVYVDAVYDYSDDSAITVPDDIVASAVTEDVADAAGSVTDLLGEF